jgi:glutamyl-tRNA reductase
MQPGTASRFESFGRKVDEYIGTTAPRMEERVEEEVKKVIAYLNDEVVPEIRRNSSQALRSASEHLEKLAEHLDRNSKTRP